MGLRMPPVEERPQANVEAVETRGYISSCQASEDQGKQVVLCHAEERVRGHGTQHLQSDSSWSLLQLSLTLLSFLAPPEPQTCAAHAPDIAGVPVPLPHRLRLYPR